MSNPAHFSAIEVFDLAIQTEHNGRAFYEAAAAAASDPAVQRIMSNLAHAEGQHEATFRRLRDEAYPPEAAGEGEALPEAYSGEMVENMLALLRSRVLPDEATGLRVVSDMKDDTVALDFALAFEKDTILFMQQMRELLPENDREPIGVLIQQEHIHVRLLQQFKDAHA